MKKVLLFVFLLISIKSTIFSQDRYHDSLALVALYNSTNGKNWINNGNWLTNQPINTWYGIYVNNDRVVSIALILNNVNGPLPEEIKYLNELTELNFSNWDSQNSSMPLDTNLHNKVTGTLIKEIFSLEKLQVLNFLWNRLSGELPTDISNLKSLRSLSVYGNKMIGIVPDELGYLTELNFVQLSRNSFSGDIPQSFQNLINLTHLSFEYNKISNLPNLSNLKKIRTLRIQSNYLEFDDIEPNVRYYVNEFLYSPQNSIGEGKTDSVLVGTSYEFDVSVGGTKNKYTWRKSLKILTNESDSSNYIIPKVMPSDKGHYFCTITNVNVPLLDLSSNNINLIPLYSEMKLNIESERNYNLLCDKSINDTIVFTNNGNIPLEINDLQLSSKGINDFEITHPNLPFKIPPGLSEKIIITFSRDVPGTSKSVLKIISNSYIDSIKSIELFGTKNIFDFIIADTLIKFNTTIINSEIDTSTMIINSGTVPIEWNVPILNNAFIIDSIIPITTLPGDTSIVYLRFIGGNHDSLYKGIFIFNDSCNNTKSINLIAEVDKQYNLTLQVGSDSANVNEKVTIPIYLRNSPNIEFSKITNITTDIVFNSTLLTVENYKEIDIKDGLRRISLILPTKPIYDSTLAEIKFYTALGNSKETILKLENMKMIGASGIIDTISGKFKLLEICEEGGERLLNTNVGNLNLSINYNPPTDDFVFIEIELIEEGFTELILFNSEGKLVKKIFSKSCNPGKQYEVININELSNGLYFFILKTPGYVKNKNFIKF